MSYFGIFFNDKILSKTFLMKNNYIIVSSSLLQGIHVPRLTEKVDKLYLASLFCYSVAKLTGLV